MTEEQEKKQQYGSFNEADQVDKEFVIELQHLLKIYQEVTFSWYVAATVNVANNELAKMLEDYAKQRLACVCELANMIIERGGNPTEDRVGSEYSHLHTIWHDDLAAITNDNSSNSLNRCLQAEDLATRAYAYMLALDLPDDIRDKLNDTHYQTIPQEHIKAHTDD